jgi:GrpB-like predicted nucleotidyltransferase (UPF0157 family)
MEAIVVPHCPKWRDEFEQEAFELKQAMGDSALAVHHIGSTSIEGILAKPIIDILIEVHSFADVDQANSAMVNLGYEVMGEFGIKGRRYFRKNNVEGIRTHHVHVFTTGSQGAIRHLAFRDYLRAHPEIAQQYSNLKAALTKADTTNMEGYISGKDPFIKEWEARAVKWYKAR